MSEKQFTLQVATKASEVPQIIDDSWCSLFNTPEFYATHAIDHQAYFFSLRDEASQMIVGRSHFAEFSPGHFASPLRGTFGGIEAVTNDLAMLEQFIRDIENHFIFIGAKSLQLALIPFAHKPAFSSCLTNTLVRLGYKIELFDLNYSMVVLAGNLVDRMDRNKQTRLRKCQREGMSFSLCQSPNQCRAAYDAILANRESKGYQLSMSYDQIANMANTFSNRFKFFTITHHSIIIAGAVCIAISSNVLYVFYWGDVPGYETFSPVVLLADGIYTFAQKNGFSILDAGRSTDLSVPNIGLIRFKEELGFEASLKLTVKKSFEYA